MSRAHARRLLVRPALVRLEDRTTPATLTWDGSDGNDWNNANNWSPAQVPSDGDELVFTGGNNRSIMVNNLPGTVAIAKITFNGQPDFFVDGGSLRLVAVVDTTANGFNEIRSALDLTGSDLTVSVANDASTIFLSGFLSGDKGVSVTKGFVLMDGEVANSYTGTTTVAAGAVLQLDKVPLAPGPTVNGPLVVNGTVKLFRSDQIAPGAPVTVTGGLEFKEGANNTLNNPVTLNGGTVVTNPDPVAGTLTLGTSGGFTTVASAATASVAGKVALTQPAHALTVADGAAASDLTVAAVLSGTGGIVKNGAGLAELTAANTYTGLTTVNAGTLVVRGEQPSAVRLNGGNLGGQGRVGEVFVAGGTLFPGIAPNPPGPTVLRTGNLSASGGTFLPRVGVSAPDTADRLSVTGTVNLANLTFAPAAGGATGLATGPVLLIENDGTDPVAGTFAGLSAGSVVTVNNQRFVLTHTGGTGNDVALLPLSVSVADATGTEVTGTMSFLVSLGVTTSVPVDINFATSNGTAVAGSDYTATSGTVTIPAGSKTATVTVPVTNDPDVEPDETFTLTLSLPPGTSDFLSDATATGTITSDDGVPVVISVDPVSVTEGDTGATATMTFTVRLSRVSAEQVTVQFATSDGTATAGPDYTATSGTLTIPAGKTSGTIAVLVIGDRAEEPAETLTLTLSNPTGGQFAAGTTATALGTIATDDTPVVISLESPAEVAEGDTGTTTATFTVRLSGPSDDPVTVQFATSDGTATAGSDYTATSGTLTIPAGQTSGTIAVTVIGDTEFEASDRFNLTLSNPAGGRFAAGSTVSAEVQLTENDAPPQRTVEAVPPVIDGPIARQSVRIGSASVVIPFVLRVGSDRQDVFVVEGVPDAPDPRVQLTFGVGVFDAAGNDVINAVERVTIAGTSPDTVTSVADTGGLRGFFGEILGNGGSGPNDEGVIRGTLTIALADLPIGDYTVQMIAAGGAFGGSQVDRDSFTLTITPPEIAPQFVAGADKGSGAVRFFGADRSVLTTAAPFGSAFTGGVRTAAADFNADGTPDLVVGTGPGGPSRINILDGKTGQTLFPPLPAFEPAFTGGVFVAAGDLDGDGRPEIVITPDEGGGPRVRIFSPTVGNEFLQLADFFGIQDTSFFGGVRPAVGDLNGDGVGDLVIAAGFTGGPRVAGFDGKSLKDTLQPDGTTKLVPKKLFGDFFAFELELRNGVFVAVGDLDGDGFGELIAGGGPGGGPRVKAFSGKALVQTPPGIAPVLEQRANFFAGPDGNRGGVRLAVKNLDGDNRADLVTGDGQNDGAKVRTYLGKDMPLDGPPPLNFELTAFDGFSGGVFVG